MLVTRKRLNTALPAHGAEFLVLGHLLVEGIQAYKAYVNNPDYDLLAVNAEAGRTARISVKSRYSVSYDGGFPLQSVACEFVVFAALNRPDPRQEQTIVVSAMPAEFYVFPIAVLEPIRKGKAGWHKVFLRDIEGGPEPYRHSWGLIAEYLADK
jgi:hypothetical protein